MKVSYNWLKEFVDIDLSPEELSEKFTTAGFEVEGLQLPHDGFDPVVVAQVKTKEKHPNADRLSFCTVDTGTEVLEIVCGAQNFKAGDKVVLAQNGTVLPDGMKLKKSKIRGVVSNGMMCSVRELGLGTEADGILILPQDAPVGTKFADYYGLNDAVFDIFLTPNRPDCLSIRGLAREVAAITGKEFKDISVDFSATGESDIKIEIEDNDGCPLYTGCRVSGVKVGPSPLWMQNRLRNSGLRPINNIVDITNYVLLELGQPMHAFDSTQIKGSTIRVRKAGDGEKVISLDSKERTLDSTMTVIADTERAVAIAGVMGLENSQIEDEATEVFLESAAFNAKSTRATSRSLGLVSDSSYRFERGIDRASVELACKRGALLMAELGEGEIISGVSFAGTKEIQNTGLTLRMSRVHRLLGMPISADKVKEILRSLHFTVEGTDEVLDIVVPSFRLDISEEADLIEEVARIYGYDNIESPISTQTVSFESDAANVSLDDILRDRLCGLGMNEVINYSFISHEHAAVDGIIAPVDKDKNIRVLNPINSEFGDMRASMLPSLMKTLKHNFNRGANNVRIFEIGKIHERSEKSGPLPFAETRTLALAIMSAKKDKALIADPEISDFSDMKGLVSAVLGEAGVIGAKLQRAEITGFHKGKCVKIIAADGSELGTFGTLSPRTIKTNDIQGQISLCEINLEALESVSCARRKYRAVSRFPASPRDMALVVDENVSWEQIKDSILALKIPELEKVEVFDEYRGDQIPEGKKSLAFECVFRAGDRTLTSEDVEALFAKIMDRLNKDYQGNIRVG